MKKWEQRQIQNAMTEGLALAWGVMLLILFFAAFHSVWNVAFPSKPHFELKPADARPSMTVVDSCNEREDPDRPDGP